MADDPATPANEASGRPAGTCTINVGFKPTRTNYTSVARLQFNSNSDDSLDRVPLAAHEHGRRHGRRRRRGPVGAAALNLRRTGASFGTFVPADGPLV